MLTLCGFAVSNYYNKVKLALLEKGIPFTEELVMTGSKDDTVLAATPLGKVPFLRTDGGTLCESQVMVDYLEAAYPAMPLVPADALAAAKVRELYAQAFFGGTVPQDAQDRVRKQLTKNIAGFQRLAKFGPFVAGDSFTLADCAAYVSLPLVALASKKVLGEDLLAAAGIDWKGYAGLIAQRPSAQKVDTDKKADAARMAAAAKAG